MRRIYNIFLLLGVIAITMVACEKDEDYSKQSNTENEVYWSEEDVKIQNQILDFQNKIKNNSFKDGEMMSVEDAVWNMEALLNFNYSTPDLQINNLTVDKSFIIDLSVENDMVSYSDVVAAVFEMEEHLLATLNSLPGADNFIFATDISIGNNELKNGSLKISMTTGFGSEYVDNPGVYIPFGENDYWRYGYGEGGCGINNSDNSDAAKEIEYKINNIENIELIDPYVDSYIVDLTPKEIIADNYANPDDVPNSNGILLDNWLDYAMYYEMERIEYPIDGCLEPIEMNFYLQGTLDVIQIELANLQIAYPNNELEFVYLFLEGNTFSYNGVNSKLHTGEITFGKRVVRIPND
ncbi:MULTISPECIES: hypothetical protein [unclassified Lentimicrobium]|uniref:hypothetical protein n=1 Tax=unclassified Lentimicrobium TaxID=2677434 RepID=UPI0015517A15|nr:MULTISPECIES: hypothetical protein [unclassified Lentimicrobium]NPD48279.1 hypothetical protein [Lentimicrobium sp. S6]NPD87043.1 hypothetical protein [Lentimicrobium sp. L6]